MDTVTPLRNKKRRTAVDSGDPEATPRPGFGPPAFAQLPPPSRSEGSAASLGQSGHSEASSPSRTSSPSKQLAWLAMHDNGVETRPLRTEQEGLPEALATFVDVLTRVYAGDGIISADHKASIDEEAKSNAAFKGVFPWMYTTATDRDNIGRTPLVTDVMAVYSWAQVAQRMRHGEDTWNMAVHFQLLRLALHGETEHQEVLVDFQACTTAAIDTRYAPMRGHSKKVDFVMAVNAKNDQDHGPVAEARIQQLCARRPGLGVNHCVHESLARRPVAVSIETKKGGDSSDQAVLQMGTWLAAQFNLLRELVGEAGCWAVENASMTAGVTAGQSDISPDDEVITARRGGDDLERTLPTNEQQLAGLPFLAAVIIHGHDWYFAAATREGQKTVLWTDLPFGDTRSAAGIFKVVAGLQHIACYVRTTFWPWYQQAVLGIEE